MSRYNTTGINPEDNKVVDVAYGYDVVPGFKPGYFFQVYSREPLEKDPLEENILVDEGFLNGISYKRLTDLSKKWQCELKSNIQKP